MLGFTNTTQTHSAYLMDRPMDTDTDLNFQNLEACCSNHRLTVEKMQPHIINDAPSNATNFLKSNRKSCGTVSILSHFEQKGLQPTTSSQEGPFTSSQYQESQFSKGDSNDTQELPDQTPSANNGIHGWRLLILSTSLCLIVFLISLDRIIVTTVCRLTPQS